MKVQILIIPKMIHQIWILFIKISEQARLEPLIYYQNLIILKLKKI